MSAEQVSATRMPSDDPRKYRVGEHLRVVGRLRGALPHPKLRCGDHVVVEPTNGDIGICVRRVSDGYVDMVWPEEVVLMTEHDPAVPDHVVRE